MEVSLQVAARVLADHHGVFDELWRRREESLSDAELLALITATRPSVGVAHVVGLLKRLRFLEPADADGTGWRLARPFEAWLEHLALQARPASAGVVRGRLESLSLHLDAFRKALQRADTRAALLVLRDVRSECSSLTDDLEHTRKAVIEAVSEAKTQQGRDAATQRYQRINHLWHTYLTPVLPLLDPSGQLEACAKAWERAIDAALESHFLPDSRTAQRVIADFHYVRLVAARSFIESCRELAPLHARLRRDSRIAEGAAQLLRQLEREEDAVESLQRRLRLNSFRVVGQISPLALQAQSARWNEVTPDDAPIDFSESPATFEAQAVAELLSSMERLDGSEFPIDDLMEWLAQRHPAEAFDTVQEVFSSVATDAHFRPEFSEPVRTYEFAGGAVLAARVRILHPTV